MKFLLKTSQRLIDGAVLLLRITVGASLLFAGGVKLFGLLGLLGLVSPVPFYENMGISPIFAYISIFAEFFGGLMLVVGFLSRLAALALAINMLVAVIVSFPSGFLNAIIPLLLLIISIAVLISGPMRISIDYLLFKENRGQ